ncbi:uncharacterized protein [Engystomops pustulosus]|uniref:uncharacterized protein n=1 Tax=Engystomops pustulosus TaxID=76066 RepID=UPI003AFB315E
MSEFEERFIYPNALYQTHATLWKRYIDDIVCIWGGPLDTLLTFQTYLNQIWPELQFTINYNQERIDFLDTTVIKNNMGLLMTDLYTKPTDRNSLLHFSSCHPTPCTQSLPNSQLQRVHRIVTDPSQKDIRLKEMCQKFRTLGYPEHTLRTPPSTDKQTTIKEPRVNFTHQYHPTIFRLHKAIRSHWSILRNIYPDIPEFANNCESSFLVYVIKCPCGLVYVGETVQHIRDRISKHKSDIRCNKLLLPLPHHFHQAKHRISQLKFQVVEHVPIPRRGGNRVKQLLLREAFWIHRLDTMTPHGLNREYEIQSLT